jgi:UDP-glucuronate 4-epimerase
MESKILVTGSLGFIGFHLVKRLIKEGYKIVGVDNINDYYDVRMKYDKLPLLGIGETNLFPNILYQSEKYPEFNFCKLDTKDRFRVEELFRQNNFDIVVNLAAKAGVQYSIRNPHTYVSNNITSFINIIDAAKNHGVKHFIYASSSSVYGNREDVPFCETDRVDNPISLYAASKKANELLAHTYSHLYKLPTTGLRFFTVYGPWGRPDMAPFIFVKRISENKTIEVFNQGDMIRDFTYIADVVEGIYKVIKDKEKAKAYRIYNIGNSAPINLNIFIQTIESLLNKKAIIEYKDVRPGDVIQTFSDTKALQKDYNYTPKTELKEGLTSFISWYENYFK